MSEQKDIERENLNYLFEKAAEKFFDTFCTTKIEPVINISGGQTSVDEINRELAKAVAKRAGNLACGAYSTEPKPSLEKVNERMRKLEEEYSQKLAKTTAKIEAFQSLLKDLSVLISD